MNTKIVIGAVVGIVLLVAGNWFYVSQEAYVGGAQNGSDSNELVVGKTFAQLLGMGQSLKCTYEYDDGGNVSSGTMYIAEGGERIRAEFNFTLSGAGPMQMFMVRSTDIDGTAHNFIWGSSMPQGIMTVVTEENRAQLFDNTDANTTAINNTLYKCEKWDVDESKFDLPTNMSFFDPDYLKENMIGAPKIGEATVQAEGTGTADIKAMQCAACDQAGPAKEQCRQALGCK